MRRALAQWTMEVVLPSLLPGLSVPEVQDLDQLDERMETHMKPWNEQIKAEGRAEGQVRILVRQAHQKFGESCASALAALLDTVKSEAVLDEVGDWLLTCRSGNALLTKVREI